MAEKPVKIPHYIRADLGLEHPKGDLLQALLGVLFLIIWILDSFYLKWTIFLAEYIPLWIRLIFSIFLFISGIIIGKKTLQLIFNETRDPPEVIKTGYFQYFRHPVYSAALMLYISFIISTMSIISYAVFLIIFLLYNFLAKFEEESLVEKFGQEYNDYLEKVSRWIPKKKTQ